MVIELTSVSKRYRREWILRDINLQLQSGQGYAISGPNGSGKSTFLRLLSGHLTPSRGKRRYLDENNQEITVDTIYQRLSFAAPYIELIEEFTLEEAIQFHQRFRPFQAGLSPQILIQDILELNRVRSLSINRFSSGMKQRVKLALACCTKADFILLDEPTTNLDQQGMDWYQELVQQFVKNRLLVVASNVEADFQACQHTISILDFKPTRNQV